jgi:hypothetical protein
MVASALQLLHWQKRRDAAQAPGSPRLLRLSPAFKQPPLLLVPRQVKEAPSVHIAGGWLLIKVPPMYAWVTVAISKSSIIVRFLAGEGAEG